MQATIQDVTFETVTKGRNSYQVATVVYTNGRGENKEKKVMSFNNPAVFATLQKAVNGTTYEVELDGAPYYNWKAISAVGGTTAATPAKSGTKTAFQEQDARRQLMIVRQSSIANAVSTLTPGAKAALNPDDVLKVAQSYVDFVYGNENLETVDGADETISEE